MKLSIQSREADLFHVALSGDVSQKHVSPLEDPLGDLLGDECYRSKVLLDMSGIEGLDSSGVSWLLSCRKRFKRNGGLFVLHSPSPFASDVLRVLNMHRIFRMAGNENEALELVQEVGK